MEYLLAQRHGRPPRLPGYDYAAQGVYFLTLCTWERRQVFGRCANGKVQLSDWGLIAEDEWLTTPLMRPYVHLDSYVIMPDHLHGLIVWDHNPVENVGPQGVTRVGPQCVAGRPPVLHRPAASVGSFVARFKAACTKRINALRSAREPPVWQQNYYEHIVRNQRSLDRLRRYVAENPMRWSLQTRP